MSDHAQPVYFGLSDAPLCGRFYSAAGSDLGIALLLVDAPDAQTNHDLEAWAQYLVFHGHANLRFDWPGQGHSAGVELEADPDSSDADTHVEIDLDQQLVWAVQALQQATAAAQVVVLAWPGAHELVKRLAVQHSAVAAWVRVGAPVQAVAHAPDFVDTGMEDPPWLAEVLGDDAKQNGGVLRFDLALASWSDAAQVALQAVLAQCAVLGNGGASPALGQPLPCYAQWSDAQQEQAMLREQWVGLLGQWGPQSAVLSERLPNWLTEGRPDGFAGLVSSTMGLATLCVLDVSQSDVLHRSVQAARQLSCVNAPVLRWWPDQAGDWLALIPKALQLLRQRDAQIPCRILVQGHLALEMWRGSLLREWENVELVLIDVDVTQLTEAGVPAMTEFEQGPFWRELGLAGWAKAAAPVKVQAERLPSVVVAAPEPSRAVEKDKKPAQAIRQWFSSWQARFLAPKGQPGTLSPSLPTARAELDKPPGNVSNQEVGPKRVAVPRVVWQDQALAWAQRGVRVHWMIFGAEAQSEPVRQWLSSWRGVWRDLASQGHLDAMWVSLPKDTPVAVYDAIWVQALAPKLSQEA